MATLATIRTYARLRADQDNSTFPTDAQYLTLINQAAHHVFRKLVRAGWAANPQSTSITATGATTYNVSTAWASIISVFRLEGGVYIPLTPLKPEEESTFFSMGNGPGQRYAVSKGLTASLQIAFYPKPSSGTYVVLFEGTFGGFAADADPWNGPPGSEELISLLAATWSSKKENGDLWPILQQEYDELYSTMCEEFGWLDQRGTKTVRDVNEVRRMTDGSDWNATEGWY